MWIVHYKDGEEKGVHQVAEHAVSNHVKFYEEYGYKCEILTDKEYWERYES